MSSRGAGTTHGSAMLAAGVCTQCLHTTPAQPLHNPCTQPLHLCRGSPGTSRRGTATAPARPAAGPAWIPGQVTVVGASERDGGWQANAVCAPPNRTGPGSAKRTAHVWGNTTLCNHPALVNVADHRHNPPPGAPDCHDRSPSPPPLPQPLHLPTAPCSAGLACESMRRQYSRRDTASCRTPCMARAAHGRRGWLSGGGLQAAAPREAGRSLGTAACNTASPGTLRPRHLHATQPFTRRPAAHQPTFSVKSKAAAVPPVASHQSTVRCRWASWLYASTPSAIDQYNTSGDARHCKTRRRAWLAASAAAWCPSCTWRHTPHGACPAPASAHPSLVKFTSSAPAH